MQLRLLAGAHFLIERNETVECLPLTVHKSRTAGSGDTYARSRLDKGLIFLTDTGQVPIPLPDS